MQDASKRRWLDGEFFAAHLNDAPNLGTYYVKWGDAEMTQLASALEYCHAIGAPPQCTNLDLRGVDIGDAGAIALASACASGALPQCQELWLMSNKIGDAGIAALAQAIKPVSEGGSGALPKLSSLWIDGPSEQLKAHFSSKGIKLNTF